MKSAKRFYNYQAYWRRHKYKIVSFTSVSRAYHPWRSQKRGQRLRCTYQHPPAVPMRRGHVLDSNRSCWPSLRNPFEGGHEAVQQLPHPSESDGGASRVVTCVYGCVGYNRPGTSALVQAQLASAKKRKLLPLTSTIQAKRRPGLLLLRQPSMVHAQNCCQLATQNPSTKRLGADGAVVLFTISDKRQRRG